MHNQVNFTFQDREKYEHLLEDNENKRLDTNDVRDILIDRDLVKQRKLGLRSRNITPKQPKKVVLEIDHLKNEAS